MKLFTLNVFCIGLALSCLVACQTNKKEKKNPQRKVVQPTDTTQPNSAHKPEDIIRDLYNAINQEKFRNAYNLWEDEGAASNLSFQEFVEGYKKTDTTKINFTGDIEVHGAAGSLYAEVPIRIASQLKNGEQQVFSGNYILRKPNTESQESNISWHIYDSNITKD